MFFLVFTAGIRIRHKKLERMRPVHDSREIHRKMPGQFYREILIHEGNNQDLSFGQKQVDVPCKTGGVGVIVQEEIGFVAFEDDGEFEGGEELHAFEFDVPLAFVAGHFGHVPHEFRPALVVEEREVDEVGVAGGGAGGTGNGFEEGRVFPGELEVGGHVAAEPFFGRVPRVVEVGDDVFKVAHHVVERKADQFFFGAEVVPHGGNVHMGFRGDAADGGFFESFFPQDTGRGFHHTLADAFAFFSEFLVQGEILSEKLGIRS